MKPTAAGMALLLGLSAAGCGSDAAGGDDDGVGPGVADAGVPDAAPPAVRFVVMGDTGEGNDTQYKVGDAVAATCAAQGCDFVLLLGDNIYNSGVDSVDDPQWQTKFEEPYADIDLPFYAVLGNHDYGGNLAGIEQGGLGNEWDKGPLEVMYSDVSDKWIMPATYYTVTWDHVGFIMLDTNSILWGNTDYGDQRAWYPSALAEVADSDWVFAAGHHPYRSNGVHGNAGNYESIEVGNLAIPNPVPILNGGNVKSFMEDVVCGTVDIYFAAHDHDRQWLDENDMLCGAELIISGAGAKIREVGDNGNQVHWQDDTMAGFLWVEIVGDRLTGQFINENGTMEYERSIQK